MTDQRPITPPEGLVLSLRNSAPHGIRDAGVTREIWLINHAYAAGSDAELEACWEWLVNKLTFREDGIRFADELRAARRPKAPSLKAQALEELNKWREVIGVPQLDIIRNALEQLND
jgi:hypothetical protein